MHERTEFMQEPPPSSMHTWTKYSWWLEWKEPIKNSWPELELTLRRPKPTRNQTNQHPSNLMYASTRTPPPLLPSYPFSQDLVHVYLMIEWREIYYAATLGYLGFMWEMLCEIRSIKWKGYRDIWGESAEQKEEDQRPFQKFITNVFSHFNISLMLCTLNII